MKSKERIPVALDTCVIINLSVAFDDSYTEDEKIIKFGGYGLFKKNYPNFVQDIKDGVFDLYILPSVFEELVDENGILYDTNTNFVKNYCKVIDVEESYQEEWAEKIIKLSKRYCKEAGMEENETMKKNIYKKFTGDIVPGNDALHMAQAASLGLCFITENYKHFIGEKKTLSTNDSVSANNQSKSVSYKYGTEIREKIVEINDELNLYYPGFTSGTRMVSKPYSVFELDKFIKDYNFLPMVSRPLTREYIERTKKDLKPQIRIRDITPTGEDYEGLGEEEQSPDNTLGL